MKTKHFNFNSKWARLGLLTLALSSTLSITPYRELIEQRSFALEPAAHGSTSGQDLVTQVQVMNSPTLETVQIYTIDVVINLDDGTPKKIKATLKKAANGHVSVEVPWNQTEAHVCIDNTCSDQKIMNLDILFADISNKSLSDLQIEILEALQKATPKKVESATEVKAEVKIDSSILEKILPDGIKELTEGGKLLAAVAKDCESKSERKFSSLRMNCHSERFLNILKGDHKPSEKEALNFYKNYMDEEYVELLKQDTKMSRYDSYRGFDSRVEKQNQALASIEKLHVQIPSGFLSLREALVNTQEKALLSATVSYVETFIKTPEKILNQNQLNERSFNANTYLSNILNPLFRGNYNTINLGTTSAVNNNNLSSGLGEYLMRFYNQFDQNYSTAFNKYLSSTNRQEQDTWFKKLTEPLPPLDLSRYQLPTAASATLPPAGAAPVPNTTQTRGRVFGRGL